MSLLKNIWRPNDSPQGPKRNIPPGETVLTERLAELLGRDLEEALEETTTASEPAESSSNSKKEASGNGHGNSLATTEEAPATPAATPSEPGGPQPPRRRTISSMSGPASLARATEEALARLKAVEAEMETEFRSRMEEFGRSLETNLGRAERAPADHSPIEEAAEGFRREARDWFDEARHELRDQLDASRSSLEDELRQSHESLIETARTRILEMARTSLDTSAKTSFQDDRRRIEQWLEEQGEASRRQTDAAAKKVEQAAEQAMERLRSLESKIETSFREQVEDYRRAVENAVAEMERKGISQANFQHAAEELQRATEQILDRSTKQIEQQTSQALSRLADRMGAAQEQLAAAARQSLESALNEQKQRWMAAWQEQSRSARESMAEELAHGRAELEAARQAIESELHKAADEQGRQLAENAAAELRSDKFRQLILADASAEMQRAADEVIGRSTGQLKQLSESELAGLAESFGKTTRGFLEGVQHQLDQASVSWFETSGKQVQEEYRARIAGWIEEQSAAVRQQTEAAGQSMVKMAESAQARLESIARETESSFLARANDQQKRWVESALEQARQQGFDRKVIEQALSELDTSTKQFLAESKTRMAEQADASRKSIAAEMDQSARKLLDGVEASLEKISWEHRGRLAQWWEERSQTARRESETAAESVTRAGQQAANQLRTVQSEIETQLKNVSREQQLKLMDSAMEEMRRSGTIDRVATEASGSIRNTANEILARSSEQLREHVEASRLALENQAQAVRRGMAEELARKAEQAQSSVESAGKAVTEDYRRQLSVWWEERTQSARREAEESTTLISRSARVASDQLLNIRKEMESELRSGMDQYRKSLREAAAEELRRQGFQQEMLDAIGAEISRKTQELASRSTKELQQHVDNSLNGLEEKFKTTRQTHIDETQRQLAELTRTSLDMATSRYHEFLTKNVQELEREQEEWLQRKRETIWLDINNRGGSSASSASSSSASSSLKSPFQSTEAQQEHGGSSIIGKLVMIVGVIAMAAVLTALFVKFAPQKAYTMEITTNPPAGFVDQQKTWSPQRRARELQLAQAYWMVGINTLQHRYPFNTELPATPPPEFAVDQNGLKDDASIRDRYWQKMREVWKNKDDWKQVEVSGGTFGNILAWMRSKLLSPTNAAPAEAAK